MTDRPTLKMILIGAWELPGSVVVPGNLMPSGTTYTANNGVIEAQPLDVGALIGLGFFLAVIDCGVLGQ